jgi:GNAT superfamily N-acetyltransferase
VAGAEVILRRVESADQLANAATLAREFGDWAAERIRVELGIVVPAGADHPTSVLDDVLESGGRLYVAEVDGHAVGVGGLKLLSKTVGEFKRMFVRPAARGLGVGRTIVEQLIGDARSLGCETIYLESASFMHSAHALYRSAGFVPSDSYPGREFEGVLPDSPVIMRLDLAQPRLRLRL